MMKIYTKTGDTGQTALLGGRRVSKAELRIDAYGTVDELNAWIGLVRDQPVNKSRQDLLKAVQDQLFIIGSGLALDPEQPIKMTLPSLTADEVLALEIAIDAIDATLPELRSFILPGGDQAVSFCHLARTVCRRAERLVIALDAVSPVQPVVIQYLNRLSDYLFVLSRQMMQDLGRTEVVWTSRG
jgi:cob(I)alamin adenosyltransferase